MWMLPLYLHVNQKSDYDDMICQALQDVFLAVVDLLNIKYLSCGILIKGCLGLKCNHNCQKKRKEKCGKYMLLSAAQR